MNTYKDEARALGKKLVCQTTSYGANYSCDQARCQGEITRGKTRNCFVSLDAILVKKF